ncbi:MAG: WD40 repeat domain-containing protein [Candidatus Solibacter sp.]
MARVTGQALLALLAAAMSLGAATAPVTALAFTPDGKMLVVGGYKEVALWNPLDGKLVGKWPGLAGQVRALAFGKESGTVAVATGVPGRAGAVELLDLATGGITAIEQAKDEVRAVAISPDGRYLATGGADGIVRIWNLESKVSRELKGHSDWITGVTFSPDGKLFATSSADRTARVWKTETWKEEFQVPLVITEPVTAISFAPEGDLLAFTTGGPEERAVRTWRTRGAFTEIDSSRPGARNQVMQTRTLDTGACMPLALAWTKATPHSRVIVGCTDKTVRVMGQGGNTFATLASHADWIYAVAARPDGSRIASGGGDGAVKIWNSAGRLLFTLGEGTTLP